MRSSWLLLAGLMSLGNLACGGGSQAPASETTGGSGSGGSGAAPWRPFSDESPWNVPIPSNPDLEPGSAALIAAFAASSPYGSNLDINLDGWSIPLYSADATTPIFSVVAALGGEGWVGTNGIDAVADMPIPAGATPDPEADHHLLVVDRVLMKEWGCFNMRQQAGHWRADLCATADLSGSGVRPPATLANPWYLAHGARACGFPLVAGLIRTEEIEAGRIDHALVVAYPGIRSGRFTPPASTGSAIGTPGGIPCGGRIQLDPSVDVDALAVSRSTKVILRALQRYGAYVGDYSGSISLYAENAPAALARWRSGILGGSELAGAVDLLRFRVIRLGPLLDNGNEG